MLIKSKLSSLLLAFSFVALLSGCFYSTQVSDDVPPKTYALREVPLPQEPKQFLFAFWQVSNMGSLCMNRGGRPGRQLGCDTTRDLFDVNSSMPTSLTFRADCTGSLDDDGRCPKETPLTPSSERLNWEPHPHNGKALSIFMGYPRYVLDRLDTVGSPELKRQMIDGAVELLGNLAEVGIWDEIFQQNFDELIGARNQLSSDSATSESNETTDAIDDAVSIVEDDTAEADAVQQANEAEQAEENEFCRLNPDAEQCG